MQFGHGLRLARIDVRRMVRKRTDPDSRFASVVSVGLYALLTVGLTVGGAYLGRALGRALVSGSMGFLPVSAASGARGLVGVFWVMAVVVFGIRAVGQRGTLTNADGVLTIVPTGEAYLGLVAAEWVYLLLWTLLPAAGVGVGLSLGAEVLWPLAGAPLLVVLGGASAVTTAYALGIGLRHVVTRFPFVARHKNGLIALVFVAYMAAIVSGSLNQMIDALFEPMAASPIGWYADLALAGLPGVAFERTYAAGAVVATAVLVAVGVAAGIRIAQYHWFADPALAGEEPDEPVETGTTASGSAASGAGDGATGDAGATAGDAGAAAGDPSVASDEVGASALAGASESWLAVRLERVLDRPTAALVVLAWRRAARSPLKLMYAAYPLFFATGIFVDIVQTGEIPAYLPYGLVVFVAWAGGVVFTLNPLGDQGAVLATTLLSEVTGRRFVRAHVLAGLLVVVPLGTALVALAAVLSPLDVGRVALLVALAPVATVVAAGLSVGIGTAFPRFEATNVTRSMEAVVPSPWAFVLFSAHVVATTLAALFVGLEGARSLGSTLLTALLTSVIPLGVDVSAQALLYGSAVALVVLLALPVVSYRHAVRTFDEYTLA